MKLNFLTIPALSLLVLATSCNRALDNQTPSGSVDDKTVFSTFDGFEQATKGMYYRMLGSYMAGGDVALNLTSSFDILTDNLMITTVGRRSQASLGSYLITGTDNFGAMTSAYSIIRAANLIIENKNNVAGTDNFYGEALTARALAHFDLLRIYSKPMSGLKADPNSLGMPYVTTSDVTNKPGRGTVKQTYDAIVADLITATSVINTNNGVGRLNRNATYALLSRVYLYGGEWQKCIDASVAVTSTSPGTQSEIVNIFKDATNNGVIFKVVNTSLEGVTVGSGYLQRSGTSSYKCEWVCSKSLFDLYKVTDARRSAYILPNANFSGSQYNAIIKWLSKSGTADNIVDVKYLRVAEVILNKAEAHAMLDQDGLALAEINKLRSNRYSDYVPGTETGDALKFVIDLERRLELAFEGDRWFTLKRKGLPLVRDAFGDKASGDGDQMGMTPQTISADDYRWQMPIGNFATAANPNLVENPGY